MALLADAGALSTNEPTLLLQPYRMGTHGHHP